MRSLRPHRRRPIAGALLLVVTAGGCGGRAVDAVAQERADDVTSSGALVQPVCETSGALAADPLAIGRQIIDATQAWDLVLICSLVGVPRVPSGLVAYHEALLGGLSDELELVSSRVDAQMALYNFDVPSRGGAHRLGLAFQRQSRGWVLITAAFLAK